MIKYGVANNEILEYCIRKYKSGEMTKEAAFSKCRKHVVDIKNVDDFLRFC